MRDEPCKMFTLVMPFRVYERLKVMAKEHETSVGNLARKGIDLLLKSEGCKCPENVEGN